MTQYGIDRSQAAGGTGGSVTPLLADGSVPLSADWDAGSYEIRAQTFESDVATGTAPLVVASTTKVANLNADLLDGYDSGDFALVSAPVFADNVFRITDNADTTKQVALEVSGVTTGTTRTVTVPDASITLAGVNYKQTWSAQQTPLKAALTDATSTTWNCDIAQVATWTIGGNRTLVAPTNQVAGTFYTLVVTQDGTGGRTITWASVFKFPDGVAETLSTGAGSVDIFTFYSDGTNMYCVGAAKDLS